MPEDHIPSREERNRQIREARKLVKSPKPYQRAKESHGWLEQEAQEQEALMDQEAQRKADEEEKLWLWTWGDEE